MNFPRRIIFAILCFNKCFAQDFKTTVYVNDIPISNPSRVRAGVHMVAKTNNPWRNTQSFATCIRFEMKIFGQGNRKYAAVMTISDWYEKGAYVRGPFDFFIRPPTALVRFGMRNPDTRDGFAHR